ncbi:MAG TPA: DUF21 domain-containing protein [candidate division WOR-3 bacterium]|uniref:DUF21 domain-containing protein n=1 Tax=candidate division WOR-3 bacterium TaxID=2052148 RepID=A0A9C9K096_UNCW3|nr:DUF21 domain-containing protein [candidate division WOR-3 bacterium]
MLFLIIPLLLILIQGIFAASETGIISLENTKLARAEREKKKWALRVSKFLARPEQFFSTILICENFIIVIASSLFANFFIGYIGKNGAIVSTILLSVFSLTFGLFIPKSIALSNPIKTMTVLSGFIYYIEIALYPIVYVFAVVAKGLARVLKSGERTDESIYRLDIIYAMSEYEEKASRFAARFFNFSKRIVSEVMIPLEAVFLCEKGAELDALSKSQRRIYTRIPVYQGKRNNIIGVFNIKDYFYTNKISLRKPFFVGINDRCMSIFLTMKQKGEHLAVVRDSKNRTVGIVTLEDLIEELVGEIRDER